MNTNLLIRNLVDVFSTSLPLDLKYDAVCNILCNGLQACSVSALTYNGFKDELRLRGNHIVCDLEKDNSKNFFTIKYPFINCLRHIKHFQALEYIIRNSNAFDVNENHRFIDISAHEEINLLNTKYFNFIENGGGNLSISPQDLMNYSNYKNVCSNDSYSLKDDPSTSGVLYLRMLKEPKPIILPSTDVKLKKFSSLLTDNNICESCNYGFYAAYPLVCNNRVFGIMRILFASNDYDLYSNTSKDSINNVLEIIGQYFGGQYSFEGLRKIDLHKNMKTEQENFYNQFCNALRELINAWGSIIRLYDGRLNDYKIYGHSTNILPYIKKIENLKHSYNKKNIEANRELIKILDAPNNNENIEEIVAYKICFGENNYAIKDINYYFRTSGENVIETKDWNKIKKKNESLPDFEKLFNKEICAVFKEFDIREVLVLPINDQHDKLGFISFANTSHRRFNYSDVSIIFPMVQRLSLEVVRHKQEGRLGRLDIFDVFIKHINHEVIEPVGIIKNTSSNLKNEILFEGDMVKTSNIEPGLTNIISRSEDALFELKKIEAYVDIETLSEPDKINEPICDWLKAEIRLLSYKFNPENSSKGDNGLENSDASNDEKLKIKILLQFDTNTDVKLTFSEILLQSVIRHVIKNAVKYSYNEENDDVLKPTDEVDSSKRNKDGIIIIVEYIFQESKIIIDISNYGPDPGGLEIYEKNYRAPQMRSSTVKGTGLGLYIAKEFISKINNGKISHIWINHVTTFKITIPI